jgi:hypothetical protein
MSSPEGRDIARDFAEQCADMRIVEAIRISRLLELAFQEGRRIAAKEAKAALTDVLRKLS